MSKLCDEAIEKLKDRCWRICEQLQCDFLLVYAFLR